MVEPQERPTSATTLGRYLALLRGAAGLTLRQVEDATDKEISNAYLSQLENDKIAKPSPNILHALARVYDKPYEDLMEKAGYLPAASSDESSNRRRARVATFAIGDLTQEEEEQVMKFLAFLKHQRSK